MKTTQHADKTQISLTTDRASRCDDCVALSPDLDLSARMALSGRARPSILSLRLTPSRIEHVNTVLQRVLSDVRADLEAGALVAVEDRRCRTRERHHDTF